MNVLDLISEIKKVAEKLGYTISGHVPYIWIGVFCIEFRGNRIYICYGIPHPLESISIEKADKYSLLNKFLRVYEIITADRYKNEEDFARDIYKAWKVAEKRDFRRNCVHLPKFIEKFIEISPPYKVRPPLKAIPKKYILPCFSYDIVRYRFDRKLPIFEGKEFFLSTATRADTRKSGDFMWVPYTLKPKGKPEGRAVSNVCFM